jgi:hypothetical protein
MKVLRRQLRSWTFAWLLFHVASYSALLPRDCCAAHAHKPAPAPAAPASDNATCAMHHDTTPPQPARDAECSLRGACRGPLAAINSFFSAFGVLPDSLALAPDDSATIVARWNEESTLSQAVSPDPRPPRA